MREALEEHGIAGELIIISDGESAVEFIGALNSEFNGYLNLAIIDLNLPRRPGTDVIAAMRSGAGCAATPIIVLSSSDTVQDKENAARLGASRYIRKPSRLADYLDLGLIFKEMATSARS